METLTKKMASLAAMAALVVAAGCAKEPVGTATGTTGEPAVGSAATAGNAAESTSHEADEKAIRDLVVQTVEAAGRKDMDTYLRFYAPNAALVLPGLPIQYGISAPKENGFPEGYAIKMDTAKVEISAPATWPTPSAPTSRQRPDPKTVPSPTPSASGWPSSGSNPMARGEPSRTRTTSIPRSNAGEVSCCRSIRPGGGSYSAAWP